MAAHLCLRVRVIIGCALCLVAATGVAEEAQPTPRLMGVLTDNYPYSFRDEDGQMKGFAYELLSELEQVTGMKLERMVATTPEVHREFRAGRLHMLQSFAQSGQREKEFDFSFPYLTLAGAVFMRADDRPIQQLADLRGRRIMVHRGSLGEEVLTRAGLQDSIVYVGTVSEALEKLDRSEGDAVLAARLTGLALAHRMGLRKVQVLELPVPDFEVRYCVAVQKGNPELLARVNEGLAILVRTKRFDQLYQKWFGHVLPTRYTREQVMAVVLVGLAIALAIALWSASRQRAMRRDLARQARALRASEERLRAVFDGTHDGLLVASWDEAGHRFSVDQANPAACRLLAGDAGRPGSDPFAAEPELAGRIRAALSGGSSSFEYECRDRPERLRVSVTGLDGRALVVLTDITEETRSRRRLQLQEEQLRQRQKLEAIGTLAGGVAHDFNNLLTAILGHSELVRRSLPPDHAAGRSMEQVIAASCRARDLVKQILTFSRRSEARREILDPRPALNETVALLRTIARGNVDFEVVMAPDLRPVIADSSQLHQVLMNIGTNAVQAMRGLPGRLVFRAEACDLGPDATGPLGGLKPGRYVRIGIQDTGPGMSPEIQQRAFEPFFTTKAPGEGTGLGLAVVHGIMQQHGGAVLLQSEPGRGCLFQLYFPAAEDAPDVASPAAAPVPRGHGELLLLVEDEAAVLEAVSQILVRLGYRVKSYLRAADALAEFAAHPGDFAAVISDLTMPGMSGLQLHAQVQTLRPGTPFLLCSGYFSEAERSEALSQGALRLLAKPLTWETVGSAVGQLLATAQQV